MADPKSKARVERLLRGDFRPDDLMNLFLFARDHCDGRETVAEIGHFVAHHTERDKGIITRLTREWVADVRYHLSVYGPTGQPGPFDAQRMPPATRDYFRIAVNRVDAKLILEKTGLRRAAADRLMLNLADRITQNADGTWQLPAAMTTAEISLVECVSSTMVARPAFQADRLFDDFSATLKSNGLITREQIRAHSEDLRTIIQLYAVTAMHNCVIQIGDGTTTQLKARPEPEIQKIMVNAFVADALPHKPGVFIATSIFTAEASPSIHCHPDLLATKEWNFEIELAPDRRLTPLQ
jgi:hypothetical protein